MALDGLEQRGTGTPPPANVLAGAARLFDYWAIAYRRTWKGSVVSSFVTPLFYVLAMGVLLGGFIEGDPAKLEGATSYLAFVAPGMIAAQAMTTAFGETTYPVMGMVKWHKVYFGMVASPLRISEVILAHLGFVLEIPQRCIDRALCQRGEAHGGDEMRAAGGQHRRHFVA